MKMNEKEILEIWKDLMVKQKDKAILQETITEEGEMKDGEPD